VILTTATAVILVLIFLVATFNQACLIALDRWRELTVEAVLDEWDQYPPLRWWHKYALWLEGK